MITMAALLAGVAMLTQGSQAELSALLESGRSDLWITANGSRRPPPQDETPAVQLLAVDLSPVNWGSKALIGPGGKVVLFEERPSGWDWKGPAADLKTEWGVFHLSKFGEDSSFSPKWDSDFDAGGTFVYSGVIVRAMGGHLVMEVGALERARADYGLTAEQNFLGMVGTKVFYFDLAHRDRLYFFEKEAPGLRWMVALKLEPFWPSSWKPHVAEQVFQGSRPGVILVSVLAKNTAWFSTRPRWDLRGIPVDLKKAVPVAVDFQKVGTPAS